MDGDDPPPQLLPAVNHSWPLPPGSPPLLTTTHTNRNAAALLSQARLLEELGHHLDIANPVLLEEICLIPDLNLRAICGSVRGSAVPWALR